MEVVPCSSTRSMEAPLLDSGHLQPATANLVCRLNSSGLQAAGEAGARQHEAAQRSCEAAGVELPGHPAAHRQHSQQRAGGSSSRSSRRQAPPAAGCSPSASGTRVRRISEMAAFEGLYVSVVGTGMASAVSGATAGGGGEVTHGATRGPAPARALHAGRRRGAPRAVAAQPAAPPNASAHQRTVSHPASRAAFPSPPARPPAVYTHSSLRGRGRRRTP